MSDPIKPTSFDVIMLVHHATLELYGLTVQFEKTVRLAGLLRDVAEGRRTFIDSDNEALMQQFGKKFEESDPGETFEVFMHENRIRERNAARQIAGLPLDK